MECAAASEGLRNAAGEMEAGAELAPEQISTFGLHEVGVAECPDIGRVKKKRKTASIMLRSQVEDSLHL